MTNNFIKLVGLLLILANPLLTKAQIDTEGVDFNNDHIGSTVDMLPIPVNNMGTISFYGDVDYFKINIEEPCVLIIDVTGTSSPMKSRVEVKNEQGVSKGNRVADLVGSNTNMEILIDTAGFYYIRIENYEMVSSETPLPYFLSISMDSDDDFEFNQTVAIMSGATPVILSTNENLPTILQGKIRGYYRTDPWTSDYVTLAPDEDVYKITTNNMQGVIVMNLENVPANLQFQIDVVNGNPLAEGNEQISEGSRSADSNGDSLYFELLTQYSGDYYIRIKNINGNYNGEGNTSSQPYMLKLWLDTLGNEFDNTPNTASTINLNDAVLGKIRGHYRTDYGFASGSSFIELSSDMDVYKPDSCGTFQYARIFNAPPNLRLKLTAYATDGTTEMGSKTAVGNGDTLRLNANEVNGIPFFFKVEAVNTGGNPYYNNTSPHTYTLYLGYSPYADITSTFGAVCQGEPVNFTASSNVVNNWQWDFGTNAFPSNSNEQNPSGVVFNASGNQWVVLTSNTCSADSLLIEVHPSLPTPTISLMGLVLTSSSSEGNQWYFNGEPINGATNQTYTATENGMYSVCVASDEACNAPCSQNVTINTIGIEESLDVDFSIYPNPSSDLFTIETSERGQQDYYVYDATGKLVSIGMNSASRFTIDLSHLPDGTYLFRMGDTTKVLSKMK